MIPRYNPKLFTVTGTERLNSKVSTTYWSANTPLTDMYNRNTCCFNRVNFEGDFSFYLRSWVE
jgi:hypothetical protein